MLKQAGSRTARRVCVEECTLQSEEHTHGDAFAVLQAGWPHWPAGAVGLSHLDL